MPKKQRTWTELWFEQGYKEGYKEGYREGFREGYKEGRRQALQESLEAAREGLALLVSERFGDAVAAPVAAALNRTDDLEVLVEVAAWLANHESADAFLARLKRVQRSASAASQVPQLGKHCGLASVQ